MEPDNVLVCWCVMRQLDTDSPSQIADIMGIPYNQAKQLISECKPRFTPKGDDLALPGLETDNAEGMERR